MNALVAEVRRLMRSEYFWQGFAVGALAIVCSYTVAVDPDASKVERASVLVGGAVALLLLAWLVFKWVASAIAGHAIVAWYVRRRQRRKSGSESGEKLTGDDG